MEVKGILVWGAVAIAAPDVKAGARVGVTVSVPVAGVPEFPATTIVMPFFT